MVNVGELKDKIEIYSIKNVTDENTGIDTKKEILKFTLRAKHQPMNGKEFYQSASDNMEIFSKFLCRKRDISEKDIVVYNGKKFNIEFIEPIGMDFIKLHATYREV
ncbi:phage head closure protein [Clostridium perfringens]|nr:phage head closure protein [Clostridium perfringens]